MYTLEVSIIECPVVKDRLQKEAAILYTENKLKTKNQKGCSDTEHQPDFFLWTPDTRKGLVRKNILNNNIDRDHTYKNPLNKNPSVLSSTNIKHTVNAISEKDWEMLLFKAEYN